MGRSQNGQCAIYSDDGDDSTGPSRPSCWDGWHKSGGWLTHHASCDGRRPGYIWSGRQLRRQAPGPASSRAVKPALVTADARQEPGRLGRDRRLGDHPQASGRPTQVRSAGPGWRAGYRRRSCSTMARATPTRPIAGVLSGNELAGHRALRNPGALAAPASKSSGKRAAGVGRDR
jgi:hypothetical protein